LRAKDDLKKLLSSYEKCFILPKDLAVFDGKKRVEIPVDLLSDKKDLIDKFMIQDIGSATVRFNAEFLKDAGSIYLKGPAGNFEDKNFVLGSQGMFKAVAKSKAFSFMGGGHSVTALEKFAKLSDFGYVSLAGGALVQFLSGKELPGVVALERSFAMHDKEFEDFCVVGSNTMDIGVSVPAKFSDFYLGDKIRIEEDFKTTIGGGGVNVSVGLSRLGAKVAYLGKISYENKDKVVDVLKKERVEIVSCKVSKKPCAKSILLDTEDGDRIIFTYRGQNADLLLSDFNPKDINAKNYYFSALSGDGFRTQLELAKKIRNDSPYANICVALSSHLIRKEKSLNTLLKNVDVVVLNLEEAEMLCSKSRVSDCLKEIRKLVRDIVVITDGANGAYAYDGSEEYFVKSHKVAKIVDTTGSR
jgi:sugar/nucleoside kinase (ribokinase family)